MKKLTYQAYHSLVKRSYPRLSAQDLEDLTHSMLYELTTHFVPLEPVNHTLAMKALRKVRSVNRSIQTSTGIFIQHGGVCKSLIGKIKYYLPDSVKKELDFYLDCNFSATKVAKSLRISRQAAGYRIKKLIVTIQNHVPTEVLNELKDQCKHL